MSATEVKKVLVCVPSVGTQAPCPEGHSVSYVSVPMLSESAQAVIEAQLMPFDYAKAAEFWSLSFVTTISLYLVARSGGLILGLLKSR